MTDDGWALWAVFRRGPAGRAPGDGRPEALEDALAQLAGEGVVTRGVYDVSGLRADADLMFWLHGSDPAQLQGALRRIRRTGVIAPLLPTWSALGLHRDAEFSRSHVPGFLRGKSPRQWLCLYPFVRSYEWYYQDAAKRSHMLRTHGMAAREFPDVLGSTTSAFALGDYEWLLAFEADELHRLTDAMRAQRAVEARLHVREETPFFTGPRVDLAEWLNRQP